MKITIDTSKDLLDANSFGEFFRRYFFTKNEGRGCYANFNLEPFMRSCEVSEWPKDLYKLLGFFEAEDMKEFDVRVYRHKINPECFCAWYWDGDGTLLVSDGTKMARNDDCKKDYTWKFIE